MIYLDHHAASPPGPEVRARMREVSAVAWANPSSVHAAGRAARSVVERARDEVSAAIGAEPSGVVFTAGGTEACNLGVFAAGAGRSRIVSTPIEHPAVAVAVDALGVEVIRLAVPSGEGPDEDAVAAALSGSASSALAITWASHETGSVLDVERLVAVARSCGAPVFIDATQALGKVRVDVGSLGASAVAFGSSKVGGPLGAGALWLSRELALAPRILGGGQERGRRAGTPDAVALAGFGTAASLLGDRLSAMPSVAERRDRLEACLVGFGARPLGGPNRLPTVSMCAVPGWRGARLVAALDLEGLCVASGAACSSGLDTPSAVVRAMYPEEPWLAEAALRLSLAPSTSDIDVRGALEILRRVVPRRASNTFE